MTVYLSTSCYGRRPLIEAIELCKKITKDTIEISAPHDFQPNSELATILKNYKEEGIKFTLHNYFPVPEKSIVLNMAASEDAGYESSMNLVKNALYLAEIAGSPLYGIHAGYLSKAKADNKGNFIFDNEEEKYEVALNRTLKFIHTISKDFDKKGISLIVENLFPSPKKRHSLNCSVEEIRELMNQVPKTVGFLLDLGHLNVSSVILDFDRNNALDQLLKEFGNRLLEVHISENNGLKDEHLAVKKKSWQLDALHQIKEATRNNKKEVTYCIEARNADEDELKNSVDLVNNIII